MLASLPITFRLSAAHLLLLVLLARPARRRLVGERIVAAGLA